MVKLISQNVCGLGDYKKRKEVFYHLCQKAEIVCIQEMHACPKTEHIWNNMWGGHTFWSHGTRQAGGVGILIAKNVQIEIKNNTGRYVILKFCYQGDVFVLVNIYAPNEDKPSFFLEIFQKLEKIEGKRLLMGDFNLALNKTIDRNLDSSNNNDRATEMLNKFFEDTLMTDVWRDRNPNKRQYMFRKTFRQNKYVASRIDYIIIDQSMHSWIEEVKIIPGYRSDHSVVYAVLNTFAISKGVGLWWLNTRILEEPEFIEQLNSRIDDVIAIETQRKCSPAEIWETVKLAMINTAQSYSIAHVQEKKLIFEQLEKYITELEESELENQTLLEKSKQDLEELMQEKIKGVIFRAGCTWYADSEKPTKYFLNLEKNRSGAKGMSALLTANHRIEKHPQKILDSLDTFHSALYTSDESVQFSYKNQSGVVIEDQYKEAMEGKITLCELASALKGMKLNKAPGCSGLLMEIYVVFWQKIKVVLFNTINYA